MDSALPKGIWIAIAVAVLGAMAGIHFAMRGGEAVSDAPAPLERMPEPKAANGPIRVVLDPGHGGLDGGTVVFSLLEKEIALDISTRVQRELSRSGVRSVMTRDADEDVDLAQRVAIGRKFPGAPFVSIHMNRYRSASVHGAEVYVMDGKPVPLPMVPGHVSSPDKPSAMRWTDDEGNNQGFFDRRSTILGTQILDHMTVSHELKNRGVRQRKLYVVEHAPAPAVLVECGYLSNPSEARRYSKAAYRQTIAERISKGILSYLKEVEKNTTYGFQTESALAPPTLTIK